MVSIGMPVYNAEAFIRRAVESILAQSYPHFELIISDNASTDRTGEICQEYSARDHRIRYVRQKSNMGATANFKFVLDAAQHDRFIWAAADDWWDLGRLQLLVSALKGDDAAVVGSVRRYVAGEPYAEYVPMSFTKRGWWKYLMREESRCEKVYFIYGLTWRKWAVEAFDSKGMGYWGADAIYCYRLLWMGNLKSISSGTLHVNSRSTSEGGLQAKEFRYSLARLVYRAHPWDYYARYLKATPSSHKGWILLAIIVKAMVSQAHLWWRAFRRMVLRKPYVHGALPGGERRVIESGL
jgi:glycosyltransferase involved in cell wall biosynthesis